MAYILDTYNVVHAGAAMGGVVSGLNVRKLCQWIVASARPMKVTLVLDGRAKPDEPSENEFPEITLVYSGAGVSADAVIGQMVERSGNRKKLTVVTNDRAVALHARGHFANAMSCETFLAQLTGARPGAGRAAEKRLPTGKTNGVGTPGETEHWLKEFGMAPPAEKKKEPAKGEVVDEFGEVDMDRLMGGE